MSQTAIPIPPDVSVVGWTPLPVSSTIAANQSVTSTPDPVGVPFTVKLASLSWPQSGLHRLTVSLKRNGASVTSVTVRLLQGSQLIANAVTSPGTSFGNVVIDLTDAQKAYITDYTDLRVSVIAGPTSGTATFTRSTTWVAEATSVTAQLWGEGGNGGGAGGGSGGGGGGGGGYSKKVVTGISLGSICTVTVGAGGTGINTWFITSGTALANAGSSATSAGGGAGATAGIGDTTTTGGNGGSSGATGAGGGGGSGGLSGNGGNGVDWSPGVGGAGGTAGAGGGAAGGNGVIFSNPAVNGNAPGGGGGGQSGDHVGTGNGRGANGQVILTWSN